ncbi:HpcH/HpaI aldolase family protein [Natronorubrum halophilum]|uniref:HpcH/HpaI aldolase family protein n=1 Tax=Natronorubrum halophilum TaxID=1702106 RepID=UPI000EF73DD6|nr:aldolase/citrate lyase family protein [Natronorubrum halophilum]
MRNSPTLAARLNRGDTTVGVLSTIIHPNLIEVYGSLDIDFVWVDLEHGGPNPYDAERVENLARAADVSDIELILRLPTTEPALIRKVLDTGVRNVLLPRVETRAEVQRSVEAAHFTYNDDVGDRGLAGVRANSWGKEMDNYIGRSDREVQVGVMIENKRALSNLDGILTVDDLAFAFIGPWDLSHSLGHPLEESHDSVQDAIEEVEDACATADVPTMGFVNGNEDAVEKAGSGYQLLVVGSDVDALRSGISKRAADAVHGVKGSE